MKNSSGICLDLKPTLDQGSLDNEDEFVREYENHDDGDEHNYSMSHTTRYLLAGGVAGSGILSFPCHCLSSMLNIPRYF